jgi:uncharacterized protein (TIGR02001 family)
MNMKSTRTIVSALAGIGLVASVAPSFAADSPHTLTANVGLYSQYIFRGLNQTNFDPAIQGGFDYAHSSGFYLGTWASNISWLKENLTVGPPQVTLGTYKNGGSLEWDFYGGYKGSVGDFGYDVGLLQYYYPGDVYAGFNKANTLEGYVAGTWKWFTLKYSHSLGSKTFGVADSRGTYYLDLAASVPLGETGLTLGAHYGIQKYNGRDPINWNAASNDELYSYNDYKISLTYDMGKMSKTFEAMTLGVAYTDTSSAHTCGYGAFDQSGSANGAGCFGVFPKDIAKGTGTIWISKTF